MNDQQLIIWFAGFYEGEGSVSNDIQNRNRIKLSISQNDETPLKIGQEKWGGVIRKRTRTTATGKVCHGNEWILNHNQALQFISDIEEFMIIPYKINQMKRVIDNSKQEWNTRFKCSFCNCTFSDPSGRRRHEKNQHIEKGQKHKCKLCNKEYNSRDSLNRHINTCHDSAASGN
tara:strand:+ start:10217 stop:10738 length:522 start_codon:yes stop_codon:yes gene_type:complete